MANYHNGNPFYGQPGQTPRNDAYVPPATQPLRRNPSFDAGDDRNLFAAPAGHTPRATDGTSRYSSMGEIPAGYNAVRDEYADPRYSQIAALSPPRARAQSQSNYQYQYTASSLPPMSPTQSYNPQQYALPATPSQHTAYTPLSYSASTSYGNSTASSVSSPPHQPYNPAAYQAASLGGLGSPTIQRQSSMIFAQTPLSPHPYQSPPPSLPPPPPPRGADHPYGGRPAPQYPSASPGSQYGFPTQHSSQSSLTASSYNLASPTTPSTVYASGSGSISSVTSYNSRPYSGGGPIPTYTTHPSRPTEPNWTPSVDEEPPEPPAHYAADNNDKPLHIPGRALPTPPIHQTQPSSSPRRTDTLTRHPQARPLPGPPVETDDRRASSGYLNGASAHQPDQTGYDELVNKIDAAFPQTQWTGGYQSGQRPLQIDVDPLDSDRRGSAEPQSAAPAPLNLSPDERHTHTNGSVATGTGYIVNYDAYDDNSDAEAEAGMAMMAMAEEEERVQADRMQERSRRETNASTTSGLAKRTSVTSASPAPNPRADWYPPYGSSSQLGHSPYDDGTLHISPYGEEPGHDNHPVTTSGSRHSSNASRDDRAEYSDEYDYPPINDDYVHPFPEISSSARVDAGGTGGLSEPSAYHRRMSYDDDETDGSLSNRRQSRQSASEGSAGGEEELTDLFFHPGMRPLPPPPGEATENATLRPHLMPAGTYRPLEPGEQYSNSYFPVPSPDSYAPTVPSPTQFSRSTSLTSQPIGPRADPPIRSKTDADRAKYRQQQELLRQGALKLDPGIDPAAAAIALDLPAIPAGRRKKFHPNKLSSEDFRQCTEPWALSAVLAWVRNLAEDETDLKEHAIVDAIVALFTHKVPTMNIADAETLAARVVQNMLDQGALVNDEEWVKFGSGELSGVIFQITGTGCYSPLLHEQESETEVVGRCYSHHCMRTLKKVNLRAQGMEPQKKVEDWVTFYKVSKEVLEAHPKKEIERQNNLHEIVTTEDSFIGQLDVLRELYRDQLAKSNPPIIPPKHINQFLNEVFGKVDAVKKVNEEYLLAQLKYRQLVQGPFIVGFSDIFREWIRKAKSVYISYAATFPRANYLVRKEAERNLVFRQFLSTARDHKLSNRLNWDTFLKAPITRIQRIALLLTTVHHNMLKDSEEKTNLAQAIEEIKIVALECDNKVGEMTKKVDLIELSAKLKLRSDMRKDVELNLDHLGREIIFRGDLQRPGTRTRFLVDTHAILFDHYLVLAKHSAGRDATRTANYDVSKLPIPMDLLVLESTHEDPVVKSAVRGVVSAAGAQPAARGSAGIVHTNTDASGKTLVPATVLENPKDDRVLYPFKIKHLGRDGTYTLYASSPQNRKEWCDKITEAKTKHAAALYTQNSEPFRLRVLADTAFSSSDSSPPANSVIIKGTPLDRAVKEVEKDYPTTSRPSPICRASVHCATVFEQPPGRKMCAIGTDYGVYISEYNNPRGWTRAIPMVRVTQIAVFEEFNIFLLIADKSLIAYHLDVVCPASGVPTQTTSNDSVRRAPQKLSGNREVGFFAAGQMKDRTLVMYKKRDGLSSTFKILEPVLQKSATSRGRFFSSRRGQTEFFREYDEFYIPAESYGINLFHSSLAISTQKGIEILTLDKKQTWSIPEFRTDAPEAQAHLSKIAQRILGLRPLGMFRLSDAEFLVTYTECAVYVNQHGDVSRSVVMEFVGRAHSACLYGKFLVLFNEDFVEVRNAMNGRLRQVIPGHNVVCLDDGSRFPGSGVNSIPTSSGGTVNLSSGSSNGASLATQGRTVKICMQHPDYPRNLIVLELVENDGQKD
ncbi:CNH domain-containing protein [Aspergillus granulosus]|uniref:CNH domain-containing protein n=1 Tax=Aspergillus granulosus TaxID=176169 RepID=A0ABR4HAX4_9EURO